MGSKKVIHYIILLIGTISALVIAGDGLTSYSESLNKLIFGKKLITTEKEKIQTIVTLGMWIGLYLFGFSVSVMLLRIFTGKIKNTAEDPAHIAALNRIIANTIQQSVIFIGLYTAFLFFDNDHISKVEGAKALALASLFVVGRIFYAIGYLVGTLTGFLTFRSLGFAINLLVNFTLVFHHLGLQPFSLINAHVAPIVKNML